MSQEEQPGITRVSFAGDQPDESNALQLVVPTTHERASLAALEAIATPITLERKDILIQRSAAITAVSGPEDIKLATEVSGLLKGLARDVEKSRKSLKDPVLIIGQAIDGVAKSIADHVASESKRLEKLIGDHLANLERQRQEQIRRQEAEAQRQRDEQAQIARAAQAEADRIEREARAKVEAELERQASEARKAQEEADRKANEAKGKERARLQAEAEQLRLDNEKAVADAKLEAEFELEAARETAQEAITEAQVQAEAPVLVPIIAPVAKAQGAAVCFDYDFEVTDIAELYRTNPMCVELKSKPSVIKAVIKSAAQQSGGQTFSIPGLRISPVTRVATRSK